MKLNKLKFKKVKYGRILSMGNIYSYTKNDAECQHNYGYGGNDDECWV
jgi:hypothetical protein